MEGSASFIFSKALIFKKSDFSKDFSPMEISHLALEDKIKHFHPERRLEFQLSRYAAFLLYKELTNKSLEQLNSNIDNSLNWPSEVVGSISHSREFVIVAMGFTEKLSSIGIDIERIGRIKENLNRIILNEFDLKIHSQLTNDVLFTLIFSAKESLYKALRPLAGVFFGFDAAHVSAIDYDHGEFIISLNFDLPNGFTKEWGSKIKGHFKIHENNILTSIEIPK